MARIEADREDLMRDASALVRRSEWTVPGEPHQVVAGTRRDGGLSVYFGDDPCFHFDAQNALRRAFVGGLLYRTQGATLARLKRVRDDASTQLHRLDLSPSELSTFLGVMLERLAVFTAALEDGAARLQRSVPENASLGVEIHPRLQKILKEPRLAPALPTRKR
jgi:hypothetical protein